MAAQSSPLFESLFNAIRLRLLFHGHVIGPRVWSAPSGHPMNRLYFFLRGRATVFEGERAYPLRPGNVYLFPLNRPYRFEGAGAFAKWFFDFRAEVFPGWDLFEQTPTGLSVPLAARSETRKFIGRLSGENVEDLVEATGLLWQILSRFLRIGPADFRERTLLAARYAPLRAVVEGRSFGEIVLGRVAAGMGLSLFQLSKRFKADTGLTLERYVAHEFVERAKIQLLLTDRNVREISGALGFSSEFYFSRFFKRHSGHSPRTYRRLHPWAFAPTAPPNGASKRLSATGSQKIGASQRGG